MILSKNTINIPKIIFPTISNKDQLRKILNVNQWDKFNESLFYKLKLAVEIFFNRYIYYHLKDTIPHKIKIFCCACKYGNIEIVQLMIEKIESALSTLSPMKRGEIVDDIWNGGLYYACRGGYLSIVQLMIEKIENELSILPPVSPDEKKDNSWNWGLSCACLGGHLLIVQLMINKGANNWNEGLEIANVENHLEIANYLSKLLKIENQ